MMVCSSLTNFVGKLFNSCQIYSLMKKNFGKKISQNLSKQLQKKIVLKVNDASDFDIWVPSDPKWALFSCMFLSFFSVA